MIGPNIWLFHLLCECFKDSCFDCLHESYELESVMYILHGSWCTLALLDFYVLMPPLLTCVLEFFSMPMPNQCKDWPFVTKADSKYSIKIYIFSAFPLCLIGISRVWELNWIYWWNLEIPPLDQRSIDPKVRKATIDNRGTCSKFPFMAFLTFAILFFSYNIPRDGSWS